ncbi:MAG: hypothetical protein HFE57_04965 [Firmicutes bacterium]|nr:hypothetical protein [Bacillota bacterium]
MFYYVKSMLKTLYFINRNVKLNLFEGIYSKNSKRKVKRNQIDYKHSVFYNAVLFYGKWYSLIFV